MKGASDRVILVDMGYNVLKGLEALLGGIGTLIVLFYLQYFFIKDIEGFAPFAYAVIFFMTAPVFSLLMVVVYYRLLIKNRYLISIKEDKTFLISLGLALVMANLYFLFLYSGFINSSLLYTVSAACIVSFIMVRRSRLLTKIIYVAVVLAGSYVFVSLADSLMYQPKIMSPLNLER